MTEVKIKPPFIKLEQLLKFCAAVETGGDAKNLIQCGSVLVNGEVCMMRGKKLYDGDRVRINGETEEYICKISE